MMADEYAAYKVPRLEPPCKVSKLKVSKDDTDQGPDEHASEAQFLQHKTKGMKKLPSMQLVVACFKFL